MFRKDKHWLVIMNEGERRLTQVALETMALHPRMGFKDGFWKSAEAREGHRARVAALAARIAERRGAFRLSVDKGDLYDVEEAFGLYENIVAPDLEERHALLGMAYRFRDERLSTFADFDPGMLVPEASTKDDVGSLPPLPDRRIIIVRHKGDTPDYIREFHRGPCEDDASYAARAAAEVARRTADTERSVREFGRGDLADLRYGVVWMNGLDMPDPGLPYAYFHSNDQRARVRG